ncbi:MAG: UPF0175 family protein [Candidatus Methylumidiphilus sp.]
MQADEFDGPIPDWITVHSVQDAESRFLLAVKLFELHRLSIGKAAEFCGMGKVRFLFELGRLQVPAINLDDDQIADELSED